MKKNIYSNEFYYQLFDTAKTDSDKEMFRMYFKLRLRKKVSKSRKGDEEDGEPSCHHDELIPHGKADLNNLFSTQIDKEKFYKQIKKFTLGVKEYKDLEKNAIMEYRLI